MEKCIKAVYYSDATNMSIESKLEFFAETRHSYGRTALFLSGGATFGKFHFGLLFALYEQDLMPRIICGSSVGSLILACMSSIPYGKLEKFFDPNFLFKNNILGYKFENKYEFIWELLKGNVVLDTQTLKDYVVPFVGDLTFKEVY